jgi:hypothetical protein
MRTKTETDRIRDCVLRQLGPGWIGKVWRNLGWHVLWVNGAVSLYYSQPLGVGSVSYWAMIGDIGSTAGSIELTERNCPHFKTPRKAVIHACEYAQKQHAIERVPIMQSVAKVLRSAKQR